MSDRFSGSEKEPIAPRGAGVPYADHERRFPSVSGSELEFVEQILFETDLGHPALPSGKRGPCVLEIAYDPATITCRETAPTRVLHGRDDRYQPPDQGTAGGEDPWMLRVVPSVRFP